MVEAHDIAIEKNNGNMFSFLRYARFTFLQISSSGKLVCVAHLADLSMRSSPVRAKPNPKWQEEFLLYVHNHPWPARSKAAFCSRDVVISHVTHNNNKGSSLPPLKVEVWLEEFVPGLY